MPLHGRKVAGVVPSGAELMVQLPLRKHTQVLREHLSLPGARVLDVGCGDGQLVRFMAREGARVLGLEIGAERLAAARTAAPAGEERYLVGRGESLPLADAACDIVVYFNSLHHVPPSLQLRALREAARVLQHDGLLYVMEPIAAGSYFELLRPIEDETEVRAAAYAAVAAAAAGPDFLQELEYAYSSAYKVESPEHWKRQVLAIDPERRAVFEARETAFLAAFEAAAERRDGAYWFVLPNRLSLLRRR